MGWVWVLIPLTFILLWPINEWIEFKKKQVKLGASTSDLEQRVDTQQQELLHALRRIENLESIVANEVFEDFEDQKHVIIGEPSDAERIERLSRRLRI